MELSVTDLVQWIPILAWPMGDGQQLYAKYTTEGLGAGILVPQGRGSVGTNGIEAVGCDVICEGVKQLMSVERGRKARERAQELRIMARKAMEKGGSSDRRLDEMIES